MKFINLFLSVLLFIWICLIFLPSFKLGFSLLDDGLMVKNSRSIINSAKKLNFSQINNIILEPNQGRVRPAYWLILVPINFFGFYNPHLIHIYRFFLLLLTIAGMFYFMSKFQINILWKVAALFIFASNIQNFENYYRLGPVEPLLAFYFVFTLILLLDKKSSILKNIFLVTLLITASFTKETYFVPSFIFLGFGLFASDKILAKYVKKKLILSSLLLFIIELIIFAIHSTYKSSISYSSGYKIDSRMIYGNLVSFINQILNYQFPFAQISLIYLFFYCLHQIKNRFKNLKYSDYIFITLWFTIFCELIILLPWLYSLGRYLIIVNICLALIYAITFNKIMESTKNVKHHISKINKKNILEYQNNFIYILFVIALGAFLLRNIIDIANLQTWTNVDYVLSRDSVKALALNIPPNSTVYVNYKKNDNNLELYSETNWHLEEFYARKDIKFIYLSKNDLCIKESRFIFDRSSDRLIQNSEFNGATFFKVQKDSIYYEPLESSGVLKSFIYGIKSENWNSKYLFNWGIYIQKPNTCINKEHLL